MSLPTDAAGRKATPLATGFLDYFPDAAVAVATLSRIGNDQHNPGKPLHWDRSKSTDEADCLLRHFLERGTIDTDGVRHSAKVAWRAMALLQKEIEGANSPGEKFAIAAADRLAVATAKRLVHNADPTTHHGGQLISLPSGPIEVRAKPGESMSEAICRTTREAHGLPSMQEQNPSL